MPRCKPVSWWLCQCHRSDEPCDRIIYEGTLCDICSIGCAEVRIGAPSDLFVMMRTILTHTKMDLNVPKREGTIALRKLP